MPHESTEFTAVVHQTVATSKELTEFLQEEVTKSTDGNITLSTVQARLIATQMRITANLCAGLLEENATMMERVHELVDRVHKKG